MVLTQSVNYARKQKNLPYHGKLFHEILFN